jgi:hypothetical protein
MTTSRWSLYVNHPFLGATPDHLTYKFGKEQLNPAGFSGTEEMLRTERDTSRRTLILQVSEYCNDP